ncbi:MAG TPA: hypothetical protein VGM98_07005 [Schlesneria sp.]|jgi:hypothetical protein
MTQNEGSPANVLGMLTALIVGEIGAAVAIIGGLSTAFACLNRASYGSPNDQWKFYLAAGGLFLAILAICRITRRT